MAIAAYVPARCPRVGGPVGAESPGPTVKVDWIKKLTPEVHVGRVKVTCNQIDPLHPACQSCLLQPGVEVQLEQNLS